MVHVGTGSWNPPAPTSGGGAGGGSRYGGADKCPRCGKTVYMAEKIVGAGSVRILIIVVINSNVIVAFNYSRGTRDALTALHVRRNWTPLPSVTKMEKSTAKVSRDH